MRAQAIARGVIPIPAMLVCIHGAKVKVRLFIGLRYEGKHCSQTSPRVQLQRVADHHGNSSGLKTGASHVKFRHT
jgi:hypothetical protein